MEQNAIADDTGAKKENLLERLNKRNKERQNYWGVKEEQRQKEVLQQEGIAYFEQTFAERTRDIENHVNSLNEITKKSAGGDILPAVNLGKQFVDIALQIQELQGYLTASTIFLADAKIKCCQQVLNELSTSCEELRQRLVPKKKFGFSGRKTAPKTNVGLDSKAADKIDAPEKKTATKFNWTLENRKEAHIRLTGIDVNGKDITITNLKNCLVELRGYAGSLQISNAIDCIFLCGPISRSVFAEHCKGSTLAIACQQLRLHSSNTMRIYLHVTCRAIIEDCRQVEIAEYNYDYDGIEEDFKNANLNKSQNNYTDVADFNWLSPNAPSPNWSLLKDMPAPNWSEVKRKFGEKSNLDNSVL